MIKDKKQLNIESVLDTLNEELSQKSKNMLIALNN